MKRRGGKGREEPGVSLDLPSVLIDAWTSDRNLTMPPLQTQQSANEKDGARCKRESESF